VDKGEGTLGLLVNNDQLYKDLQDAVYQLNLLIVDIKQNPKRYVRVSVF
jgi:phospholipid/cholesterol/gamma-HCH transport system substrate-binding protein